MKAHEVLLVQETLAGDRVEELFFKLSEIATAAGISKLEALIVFHLLAEGAERDLAQGDRRAIREMVTSTADSWQQIGDVAVRMLGDESH